MPDPSPNPPKVFFEGVSAPVRYLLAVCVSLFGLVFFLAPAGWTPKIVLVAFVLESISIPLALILIAPRRFVFVGRVLAGWLFALCTLYVAYQWLLPSSFMEGGVGAPNKFNSLRALLFLGLPSGWYAWKGKLI
jgi:hypothetical protein